MSAPNMTLESLTAMVLELREENQSLKDQMAELSTVSNSIEDTKLNLPKLPDNPTFKAKNGKTYELMVPSLRHPEMGYMTAEDVLADKNVCEDLVKINSGVIREIFK